MELPVSRVGPSWAVVVDGTVYWGSGYGRLGFVAGQKKFYAFSPGGK